MEEMIKVCGCENCEDKSKCNNVDLMNCYAEKKLTIKSLSTLPKEKAT